MNQLPIYIPNDGFGNWCPDCGLPRGVCDCDDWNRWADEQLYADEPRTYWVNVWDEIPDEDKE